MSGAVTSSRHRMPIHQAAAIWVLVFLIGLTGGELLRQHTLDAKAVAATSGATEPTAPAVNPAVLSPTSTTTTTSPRQTTTTVDCNPSSCLDHAAKQGSQPENGKGRGHATEGKERGGHGKGGKSATG